MSNVKASASLPYKLRPVPIPLMRPAAPGVGQREKFNEAWCNEIVATMDLNSIGHPCVNFRDGVYLIFDGQHRVEALRRFGLGDSELDCHVYENLSDADMSRIFLTLNNSKRVDAFSRFLNGVSAGLKPENDVQRMVEAQRLRISRQASDNSVGCVAACLKVYHAHGEIILGKSLRVVRDAYDGASASFESNFIQAVALVFGRYEKASEKAMVSAISPIKQGVVGIVQQAERLRLRVGNQKIHCIAATLVDIYNKHQHGNSKLPSWWQAEEAAK